MQLGWLMSGKVAGGGACVSTAHDACTSVNSQMWYESTFWTNRCRKDIYTTGEAIMCLVWWHVISPPREQKDFSHKLQSNRLEVATV